MIVSKIQRFSLHDGPGIRTTLFFKGCPLRCAWCHNPETWRCHPEPFHDRSKCRSCNQCDVLDYCPLDYKGTIGEDYSIAALVNLALKDRDFFRQSGGGITLSGGEVLSQPIDELLALVIALKKEGLHIALDTSGFGDLTKLQVLLPYLNVILYDIKLMDATKHQQFVGVDNLIILENLQWLIHNKSPNFQLVLRLPLIKDINTDREDLDELLRWLGTHDSQGSIDQIDLLPYHEMGQQKGVNLVDAITLSIYSAPDEKTIMLLKNALMSLNYAVTVGGTL